MAEYMIGQVLTCEKEHQVHMALSDTYRTVRKGSRCIIGADQFAHHMDGTIQPLAKDAVVKGYDHEGLAWYIARVMATHLPLDEMAEAYDVTMEQVQEVIEEALSEVL